MKTHKFLASVFTIIVIFGVQNLFAQNVSSVRKEVIQKLSEIKPADNKKFTYKIIVPKKIEKLADNLRLDISYKIGHYEFEYITLRFEREKSKPFVKITKFAFGSSLSFYKEYAKSDFYISQQGKISEIEFDRLLSLAFTLYKSDIEKQYLGNGTVGGSGSGSSGDGSIILNLINPKKISTPIIQENGTLHSGKLKERILNGYEDLRVHLFWEVFDEYLKNNEQIFNDLDSSTAETIIMSRLQEPQTIGNYREYYRLSAYIKVLGKIGTYRAINTLKNISTKNKLEDAWSKYLTRDALEAINKIENRTNPPQ